MKSEHLPLSFVADANSPELLTLYLSHSGIEQSSLGALDWLGWELVVTKRSPTGEELTYRDHWDQTLAQILPSAEDYSDIPLSWRWESSGEPADLLKLQPALDLSRRYESAVKASVSSDGNQRLCFNLYDDSHYRFTLEEQVAIDELRAWVPREWSSAHPDLSSAIVAARKHFYWVD